MPRLSQHLRAIRIPLIVFLLLTVLFVVLIFWTHSQMPDSIAVNYGSGGKPNRYSSKFELTWAMLGAAIIGLLSFGLVSCLLAKIPVSLMNFPHKEYWLAPERAGCSLVAFGKGHLWFGVCYVAFLTVVHWDVFQANVAREDNRLAIILWATAAFMMATIGYLIFIFRRFRKVPS